MRICRYPIGLLALGAVLACPAAIAATLTIEVGDPAGSGFNDPTPVAARPDNPGTTLGAQRLHVFNYAAARWGERLSSSQTIIVRADWQGFTTANCSSGGGTLGSAGAATIFRDFPGAPVASTWYPAALANALRGADLDPSGPDIEASFNPFVDSDPNCLGGDGYYYGTDHNAGSKVDLLNVVMHEIGHGLGFGAFVNKSTGQPLGGLFGAYDRFIFDESLNLFWTQMSDAQRVNSAVNAGNLVWNSARVARGGLFLDAGRHAEGHVRLFAPTTLQSGSSVSHWDTAASPNLLMEPFITGSLEGGEKVDLTLCLFRDLGWGVPAAFGCPDQLADIGITAVDSPDPVAPGGVITYTLTASNQGPDRATHLVVDAVRGGAASTIVGVSSSQGGCTALPCDLGTLDAGGTATVQVQVSATSAGTVTLDAEAGADQTEPELQDNFASTATTVGGDGTPDPYAFADLGDAQPSLAVQSEILTLTGFSAATTISLSGHASGRYRINNGDLRSDAGSLAPGDTVRLRLTSGATGETRTLTLNVGGVTDTWRVTAGPDRRPDAYDFPDVLGATAGTSVLSERLTPTGYAAPATITIAGHASARYTINGGSLQSAAGTLNPGDRVRLRLNAGPNGGDRRTATVTIGGLSDSWSVVTAGPDTTPDTYRFTDVTGAAAGTTVVSTPLLIGGYDTPTSISIAGHSSARYRINNGPLQSGSGTLNPGDSVRLQLFSGAAGKTRGATLTVGGITDHWSVTTAP